MQVGKTCKMMVELSTRIQDSFGWTIASGKFLLLTFYTQRIQDVFGNSVPLTIQYCYYMGRLVSTLFFGAQAHAQVKSRYAIQRKAHASTGSCIIRSLVSGNPATMDFSGR